MVTSLFEHERITTTLAKAREARPVAEKLITRAKKGDLHSRRLVASYVQNGDVVKKLFGTIAGWYTERPGGYTRIIKLGTRLGDGGEMGILELVKTGEILAADLKAREEASAKREERRAARDRARAEAASTAAAQASAAQVDEDDEDDEEEKPKKKVTKKKTTKASKPEVKAKSGKKADAKAKPAKRSKVEKKTTGRRDKKGS
jgi:large subunit ribosomal protein L17